MKRTRIVLLGGLFCILVAVAIIFFLPLGQIARSFFKDPSLTIVQSHGAPGKIVDRLPLVVPSSATSARPITINGERFFVEVQKTSESRQQGLSGRASLEKGSGMLFVFDRPGRHGFWMKDMRFAIDILWLDEYGTIVHMVKRASPDSYPTLFSPDIPSLTVLELPAGTAEEKGFFVGDQVSFGALAI